MAIQNRIAGVDEVGRGPLVGAVVTAAVILDPAKPILGLADSKKLNALRQVADMQAERLVVPVVEARAVEPHRPRRRPPNRLRPDLPPSCANPIRRLPLRRPKRCPNDRFSSKSPSRLPRRRPKPLPRPKRR